MNYMIILFNNQNQNVDTFNIWSYRIKIFVKLQRGLAEIFLPLFDLQSKEF